MRYDQYGRRYYVDHNDTYDGYLQDSSLMGQTDNSSLALNFQMFSKMFCLRGSIFSVFALEQFIFVLHYVFSDTSSTQLEQDTQGKVTKYTLGVLFTSCESCFEDSSTIFTFPCVTFVTPHLLSTI